MPAVKANATPHPARPLRGRADLPTRWGGETTQLGACYPDLPAWRGGELLFDFDRDLELVDRLLAARSLELQGLVLDDLEPDRQRSPGRLRHEHLGRAHLQSVGAAVDRYADQREL